jgi:hypothetical protein
MVSRRTYRRSSFGKKRKTHRRRGGKKKRAAIKGRRVAYVKGKGAHARKIQKRRNKRGKIVWKYSNGKTVPKSKRKYSSKAKAVGRKSTTTRHKKRRRRRAHFGSFGQGRPSTLLQMIGPYAPSSFGRRRRRTTRRPALRRRRY